ncbi:5-deoxyglucuronate isomerase [Chromohalobacter marismortui]|uniref:5-deoxyglucuronate isomerase n=1 Tax=Chromohalobacter marismortui TaxID=42055 RepID=A0A4R7NWR2_9GAMM|nr:MULTISPECIES: 5-deoxy-glucuronate isomerase [Chromohalobacter]MCI0510464.1 5-deoxy-glucuronate isomerase [Chromohalobacter sp.]MCI0594183.1 5-deoxy-glucuronate isomerase [Chromohalobacter sp.]TDU24960.1 5-deoxyglucuronate isomerase [Chromohalobacter marismortui]
MTSLQVRPQQPDEHGKVLEVTPASAGWDHVGFRVHKLAKGQHIEGHTGDREHCLVLLSGKATISSGEHRWEDIGERMDIFEKVPPYAVYLPNGVGFEIEATTDMELAVCSAPGHGNHGSRLITPDKIKRSTRGTGTNTRHIQDVLPESEPADSLLVVEVYTPAGHWSSYPPHKHDVDNLPHESSLEETYYHRLNPSQGFAFQRVYTDDRSLDETMSVENGNCVMVPRGYHPAGVPHGYELYYLNVMAGPKREWKFQNDPEHEWIVKQ